MMFGTGAIGGPVHGMGTKVLARPVCADRTWDDAMEVEAVIEPRVGEICGRDRSGARRKVRCLMQGLLRACAREEAHR